MNWGAGPVTGDSIRFTVSVAGSPVRVITLNRTAGQASLSLSGLPVGEADVLAELYAARDLNGARTGTATVPVTLGATSRLDFTVGAAVAELQVSPAAATVPLPGSRQFTAVLRDVAGRVTFAAPGAAQWSVVGPVGTIDASGLFQSTASGNGKVRLVIGGTAAEASISVSASQARRAKWNILIYLNAASDLYAYSDLNVAQMERVAGNPDVRFILQWKQTQARYPQSSFDGTRRYVLGQNPSRVQDLGTGVDMGRAATLKGFLDWAKAYYPADRTCLVVWSHGNGWRRKPNEGRTRAVSYDDETGNAIQVWELRAALSGHVVDILAWDASLMQMMEVAYEVRPHAAFVAGSEESPPAEGYPYDLVFGPFAQRPDASTRELAKGFVDGPLAVPAYAGRKITQSVVDTSKLPALAQAVDALAQRLMAGGSQYAAAVQRVRAEAQAYSQQGVRTYRDLGDVCARLAELTDLDAECSLVQLRLAEALVWEGNNANSPGSHGLSIDLTPGVQFLPNAADYGRMAFGRDTGWDDWLVVSP